jgi:hypothetical protein
MKERKAKYRLCTKRRKEREQTNIHKKREKERIINRWIDRDGEVV